MLPMSFAFAYAFGAKSFLEPESTHLFSEIQGMGNVLQNYRACLASAFQMFHISHTSAGPPAELFPGDAELPGCS